MQENVTRCRDLTDLVKNIVLGFCKINVQYTERLDIYGSLHIRADNRDVANFMLNEHCYNNSRASSPTVTSAAQVSHESDGNDDNSQMTRKNLDEHAVKMEPSVGSGENQNASADTNLWQWPDAASTMTSQHQSASFPQSSYSTTQPASAWSSNGSPRDSSAAVSKYLVPGNVLDVKTEPAASDNLLLNDDTIEILDDDCSQDANESETAEFKPGFYSGADEYGADMPYESEDYLQYDDSTSTAYQYSNVSASGYFTKQPSAASSAKRGRPRKASLPSVGENVAGSSEKVCDYCQERFASDDELSRHFMQYHQCTMPPADVRQQKHRKTHVDQAPGSQLSGSAEVVVQMYKCRVCGQIFRSRDGLNNHENVKHTGSRRYRCNFCSEEFLTRQNAYLHRVKFHRLKVRKTQ